MMALDQALDPRDLLLSPEDAAELLGVTVGYLAKLRHAGGGPEYCKLSARLTRYRRSALEAWIAARTRTSTSQSPPPDR